MKNSHIYKQNQKQGEVKCGSDNNKLAKIYQKKKKDAIDSQSPEVFKITYQKLYQVIL
jgi:hypothetical protein